MTKKYWQIAAGSEEQGRDYSDEFVRFGMAFVGGKTQCDRMAKVGVGDVFLLNKGVSQVVAVGEVVERNGKHGGDGDKQWLRDFDGWDLRSYCYVDWRVPEKPVTIKPLLAFQTTIKQTLKPEHKAVGDQLLQGPIRHFDPEPPPPVAVTDDEILRFLVSEGLRPSAADDLTDTFRRIRLLARYYYDECHWEDIREHETRTFLIVPLLLALGWAEQQLKIELPVKGGRVDIVCFSSPFHRKEKECVALIEAKAFAFGLKYAQNQVKNYATAFPSCTALVVSNGYCYRAYHRTEAGTFGDKLSAYLNVLSPTKAYPLDPTNAGGALDVLRLLMPISLR